MFKVDLEEQNRAYKASEDVGDAEVQCTADEANQVKNSMKLYSQVTLEEETSENLWTFKDVDIGQVNILLHWKQRKVFLSKR